MNRQFTGLEQNSDKKISVDFLYVRDDLICCKLESKVSKFTLQSCLLD